MIYLVFFILVFALIQFLVSLTNLIFIQKLKFNETSQNELVSVLIPARNEENNIGNILDDLINQNYKNIEIIVFDDNSDDNTNLIVTNYSKFDNRIKLITSEVLPADWKGKNHACYNLAQNANGKYFLFIDADVRLNKNAISKTIFYLKNKKLGLLSIFPIQKMVTVGEQFTVPLMNYILLTLLPLILVRKSHFVSLSAANGQFMLFNSDVYKKYEPHLIFKNEKVEDIKISRFLKNNKVKIACITGFNEISCRMYDSYTNSINGFSKNMVMFFGNSFLLAFLFWFLTTCGFIFVLIFSNPIFSYIFLALFIFTKINVSVTSKQNILKNIFYIIPQHFSMLWILFKSFINIFTKNQKWKGRYI